MLSTIKNFDSSVSDEAFRSMFAARKSVFVDLLKWDIPVLGDRYEVDQFDNPDANYIILAEPDGSHLGSTRLLPTTRPHILDSFYQGLCDEVPPSGPDIVEITRFCLDRRISAAERRQVRDGLVTALVDYALLNHIATYTAIVGIRWYRQIKGFGWDCRPLGDPRTVRDEAASKAAPGGETLIALRIDITAETPDLLKEAGIHSSSLPNNGFVLA